MTPLHALPHESAPEALEDIMVCPATRRAFSVAPELLNAQHWVSNSGNMRHVLEDMLACENVLSPLIRIFLMYDSQRCWTPTPESVDCILVLGHALLSDGGASDILQTRLGAAIDAFKRHPQSLILLSGGNPVLGMPESSVMKRILVGRGAPSDRICEEPSSFDTVGNVLHCTPWLAARHCSKVSLITSLDHAHRALSLFQCMFMKEKLSIHLDSFFCPGYINSDTSMERFLLFKDIGRVLGFWTYLRPKHGSP